MKIKMLVQTAHKNYPRLMLRQKELERDQWTSALAEIDSLKIMVTRFLDLQEKLFISSSSTDLNGPLRQTKHQEQVPRPQVAFDYLLASGNINIHYHFRTGPAVMADARQTKNAYLQQLAGLLSFCFTNGYLAYRHFRKSWVKHSGFKIKLANVLMEIKEDSHCPQRLRDSHRLSVPLLKKLQTRHMYLYCWRNQPQRKMGR